MRRFKRQCCLCGREFRNGRFGCDFGETKIENFRVTANGNEYVCGFNVAMDDAVTMSGVKRIGYLNGQG
jgi:hypothetical protein